VTSSSARIRKHSLRIAGHLTSVSMEDAFWLAFKEIAERRRMDTPINLANLAVL